MTQLADFYPTGAKTHLPMSSWPLKNGVISSAASHPFHSSFRATCRQMKTFSYSKTILYWNFRKKNLLCFPLKTQLFCSSSESEAHWAGSHWGESGSIFFIFANPFPIPGERTSWTVLPGGHSPHFLICRNHFEFTTLICLYVRF